MVDLGSSGAGRDTFAAGVSGDGQVAVGYQRQVTGFGEAESIGTRQERVPGADGFVGTANATNVDGSIVVGRIWQATGCSSGRSRLSERVGLDARRHAMPGGMPRLRTSPGPLIIVEANATSDDGSVIGGSQAVASSPDSDAIIWIDRKPAELKSFCRPTACPTRCDVDQYGRD